MRSASQVIGELSPVRGRVKTLESAIDLFVSARAPVSLNPAPYGARLADDLVRRILLEKLVALPGMALHLLSEETRLAGLAFAA